MAGRNILKSLLTVNKGNKYPHIHKMDIPLIPAGQFSFRPIYHSQTYEEQLPYIFEYPTATGVTFNGGMKFPQRGKFDDESAPIRTRKRTLEPDSVMVVPIGNRDVVPRLTPVTARDVYIANEHYMRGTPTPAELVRKSQADPTYEKRLQERLMEGYLKSSANKLDIDQLQYGFTNNPL